MYLLNNIQTILTDSLAYLFILFVSSHSTLPPRYLFVLPGYGFVDFDSPAAAQKAVASLKASGVQAQMAKVSFTRLVCFVCCHGGVSLLCIPQVD